MRRCRCRLERGLSAQSPQPAVRWLGRRHLFSVGGRGVPSYTVMLYVGCVAGVLAGSAVAGAEKLNAHRFGLAAIVLLVLALAGARLWYVVQHLQRYRAEPRRIWSRSEGGSALYGGLVLSVGVSVPVLSLADLPFWAFWDAASITMLVGLILTRIGCLMNGCCAGRETSGVFGVWLPNHRGEWRRRFPTPLLEAGWASVVLAWALATRTDLPFAGATFASVIAAYAAGRLVLDSTREHASVARAWRSNFVISGALLLVAVAVLVSGWPAS
jgi:phosphatidylglycerol---prolipoprotein diacylglyceryl transferase